MKEGKIDLHALAVLGLAGSGKSSVVARIRRNAGVSSYTFSGGRSLRKLSDAGDTVAGSLVSTGAAMPGELFVNLLMRELHALPQTPTHLLLDGNPRSLEQVQAIRALEFRSFHCIVLSVPIDVAVSRVRARAHYSSRVDDARGLASYRVRQDATLQPRIVREVGTFSDVKFIDGDRDLDAVTADALAYFDSILKK